MTTSPISSPSATATAKPAAVSSVAANKPAQLDSASIRNQQNLAILESQQQFSLSTKNEPLSLLLKAAIEGINEQLKPAFGENAIESAVENNIDVSPEATAERIVSQSTAFFSAFQQQNTNLDFEQQLEKFVSVIAGGIDKGFEEARGILDSLKVLEGDIADNIDSTYALVQTGLNDFQQQQQERNSTLG